MNLREAVRTVKLAPTKRDVEPLPARLWNESRRDLFDAAVAALRFARAQELMAEARQELDVIEGELEDLVPELEEAKALAKRANTAWAAERFKKTASMSAGG